MSDISEQDLRSKVMNSTMNLLADFYNPHATSKSQLESIINKHVDEIIELFKTYGATK